MSDLHFNGLWAAYRQFRDGWLGRLAAGALEQRGHGEIYDTSPPLASPACAERFLQIIWNEQRLAPPIRLADGRRLEVQYPGLWNVAAGPDFHHARFCVDGQPMAGDVEVHRDPRDWFRHGHDRDPRYAQVALHVVWDGVAGEGTPPLPLLALKPHLAGAWQELLQAWEENYPYASRVRPGGCALGLAERENPELRELLRRAGAARFGERVERLLRAGAVAGFDQALYAGVFEALGYKMNREPMLRLAAGLPLAALREAGSGLAREAILLGTAGLLPDPTRRPVAAAGRERLREWWDCWWRSGRTPLPDLAWQRGLQRPCNRPDRRLRAGAAWLDLCRCQPVQWLRGMAGNAPTATALRRSLEQASLATAAPAGSARLGLGRIRDILANVLLPGLAAIARQTGEEVVADRAFTAFAELPPLQGNRRLEEAAHRLLVPPSRLREVARRAVEQQGLLQIQHDFCRPFAGDCENCPFRLATG
ncbi:MAG: DUF2851 family protein [Lentisphaeria bacterium]|jgi:hypothetical protein